MKVLMNRSRKLIKQCGILSELAYQKHDNPDFIEDKYTDCMLYFKVVDTTLYLYGPGSISLRDWTLDFQIWRLRVDYFDNSLVHAGFMRIYNTIRTRVHAKITEIINSQDIKKVVCTGHSLFGAIATIIAADVARMDIIEVPVSCVTFGSPRVGNSKFASFFNNSVFESFRCVYQKDPVTFTPLPVRFKHVRGLIHHNGAALDTTFYKFNFCGCSISDHSMKTYCKEFDT
jgi:hypothetical protein